MRGIWLEHIVMIILIKFLDAYSNENEEQNKCSIMTDCFSCSKHQNCEWNKDKCGFSISQKGLLHWYEKLSLCKYEDLGFRSNIDRYCLNINSNSLPFNAAISNEALNNNITDIFCDWSINSLLPNQEYKFFFLLRNLTQFQRDNFVLVLHYRETEEVKRLLNNNFNTIGIIGFSLYYHGRDLTQESINNFTFKVIQVNPFPFDFLLAIIVGFFLVFIGCIGIVIYKNRQIQIEIKEQDFQALTSNLNRIRKILCKFKYQTMKDTHITTCTVCLEDLTDGDVICKLTCRHIFHYYCIKRWIETIISKPKCPNCNNYLLDANETNESDNNPIIINPPVIT